MDVAELRASLVRLQGLLDPAGVTWALAAGSAVYLYTQSRLPTDLDVLVRPEDLAAAGSAMEKIPRAEATAWGEAEKIEAGEIEVSGRLVIQIGDYRYPYAMDDEMARRVRRLEYEGIVVPLLAPEDIVAFKAVLRRGQEQGKHDLEDIDALASVVNLDLRYLWGRLGAMGAMDRAEPALAVRGLAP